MAFRNISSDLLSSAGLVESTNSSIPGSMAGNSQLQIDEKMTSLGIWGWGFLFVTIINLSSVMGIIFFPLMKKSFYALLMRVMIGLAIGSLSGSALFHLIPQAFGIHETHEDYMKITSFIWLAIWIVMLLECSIKIGVKMRAKAKQKREHKLRTKILNKHNNNPSIVKSIPVNGCTVTVVPPPSLPLVKNSNSVVAGENAANNHVQVETDGEESEEDDKVGELEDDSHLKLSDPHLPVYRSTLSLSKVIDKLHTKDDDEKPTHEIKTVAWIIIIGDSLHNFIDGVSIGAGFVQSFSTGAILSLAIMCEEFPHELGDFAILINSGLSVKKALLFNFMSALTCYIGLALGILLGEIQWANLIFAFAAGIFLYVALGDMVPEVTSLIDEVSDKSPKKAWGVMLTHNIGIVIGITILFALAKYQP